MYKWNSNVKFLSFMELSAVLFIIKKMCFQKGCFFNPLQIHFKIKLLHYCYKTVIL